MKKHNPEKSMKKNVNTKIEFLRKTRSKINQAVLRISPPSTLESLMTAGTIGGREDLALSRDEKDREGRNQIELAFHNAEKNRREKCLFVG